MPSQSQQAPASNMQYYNQPIGQMQSGSGGYHGYDMQANRYENFNQLNSKDSIQSNAEDLALAMFYFYSFAFHALSLCIKYTVMRLDCKAYAQLVM